MKNDVQTFYAWCKENGYGDVFRDDPRNQERFEKALIAFHEAREALKKEGI